MKCKHPFSVEYSIRLGTLKDVDRLPTEAKVKKVVATTTAVSKSYTEDQYSF